MLETLRGQANRLPELPGVYLLKDTGGRVLYVGKALSLRHRVRSYLAEKSKLSPRMRSLQAKLAELDYMVTDSEVEALILECTLIKKHRPRFNVDLKDDKDYPYLILTAELYPRLQLLRLSQQKGRRGFYQRQEGKTERRFGPYTDVGAVRDTMRLLHAVFALRRCRKPLDGNPVKERPCLDYQMKRCLAPCRGAEQVPPAAYERIVDQVVLFLRGRYGVLEKKITEQMKAAARAERFEEAASLRDRLRALQRVVGQQQKILATGRKTDQDVLALGRLGRLSAVHLFQVRDGKLLSQKHFPLRGAEGAEDTETLASFVKSYYSRADDYPSEILLSGIPADTELLGRWLTDKAGRKVNLRVPLRGISRKLVDLAGRNCLLRLEEEANKNLQRTDKPLEDLARLLGLGEKPLRIEGYDISHLQGGSVVGAMVVFAGGTPCKEEYRRFKITSVPGGDDYRALQVMVVRRARQKRWPKPDLLLVDGGPGQLNTVRQALVGTGLEEVPVVALAKKPDRLYLSGAAGPVNLTADNPLLHLLQRVRDEGHRFALAGHRSGRSRLLLDSPLEQIPGVGAARRRALLNHFGSLDALRKASPEKLASVPGIGPDLAAVICRHLQQQQLDA